MSEGSVLALPCLLVSSSAAVLEALSAESFTLLQPHLHRVGSTLESTGYLISPEPPGVTGAEEEEHKWEGMSATSQDCGKQWPLCHLALVCDVLHEVCTLTVVSPGRHADVGVIAGMGWSSRGREYLSHPELLVLGIPTGHQYPPQLTPTSSCLSHPLSVSPFLQPEVPGHRLFISWCFECCFLHICHLARCSPFSI